MLINISSHGFQFLTSCSEVLARVKIRILMGRWEMRIEREGKMKGELKMELFLPASHISKRIWLCQHHISKRIWKGTNPPWNGWKRGKKREKEEDKEYKGKGKKREIKREQEGKKEN